MIVGIGIDLCEVGRMRAALEKPGFLKRYFTEAEQAYILARGKMAAESLAGHFAAKEAFVKALGCGIVFPLDDIEVAHDELRAPRLCLRGEALSRMQALGAEVTHLSISHTDDNAAAVVILEKS